MGYSSKGSMLWPLPSLLLWGTDAHSTRVMRLWKHTKSLAQQGAEAHTSHLAAVLSFLSFAEQEACCERSSLPMTHGSEKHSTNRMCLFTASSQRLPLPSAAANVAAAAVQVGLLPGLVRAEACKSCTCCLHRM